MPAPKALALRPTVSTTTAGTAATQRPEAPGRTGAQPQSSNAAVTALLASRRVPSASPPVPASPPLPGRPASAAQDMFGNGAVAAAGQARSGPAGPVAPAPANATPAPAAAGGAQTARARPGPDADPKFAHLKKDVGHKKRALAASHPPPRTEATAAQNAARPPKDDAEAQGKTANAEKMNEARPKEFDKEAFIRAVEKAIADKAPKNLDEADKFAGSGKAEEVRAEVHGKVGEGKAESAQQIATTTAAPPDTAAAVPKQVVPMTADRPPSPPGAPDAANAVPDRLPPAATDLSAGPAEVNQRMADAQVTEAQLQRSNEPTFNQALGEKKAAERHSEVAPGRMRGHEKQVLDSATARARRLGTAAMGAMGVQRALTGQRVDTGKSGAKGRDEEKRAQVTTLLQGVFDTMQKDVQGILDGLDKLVDDQFGRGEKQARDAFTAEHKQKMEEYKDRRYAHAAGKLRWFHDLFAGLPAEADRIFEEARDHYVRRMRQVISDVATTIGAELNRAKRRIAQGRSEMRAAVDRLPADLRAMGREAAAEFSDKFDQLTQSVDDKGTQLVDTLATKYTDALKSVDDEIATEKEKNKGLVAKAVDAVKAVIDTIMELKNLLLAVLAKAAQAVMLILKDPIGFLRNLVTAVGAGLRQFLRNIGRHLQQGIMSWLLGKASEAGLELPAKFDAQGVVQMLASLLGLTWQNIRGRIVRKVPKMEPAIAAAETALPLVAEVRKRGVAGMWEDLKTRVGDLKKELLDKVIAYVTPTVVEAGIMWVLSLLNPASAFVRAVKLIIDVVRFVVTQARQIFEFVGAVLDAVIAIAQGGSGGVPSLIERALARSVPVLLGFLASLLGLGGIAAKVKQIVQALSKPVNRAVDWVIDKIVGLVKKLWAKLKASLSRKKTGANKPRTSMAARAKEWLRGGDDTPAGLRKRLDKALAAAQSAARRVKGGGRVSQTALRAVFKVIRVRYGLTSLEPLLRDGRWHARGTVNPVGEVDLDIPAGPLTQQDDDFVKEIAKHLPPLGDRFAREARERWSKDLQGKAVGGQLLWDEPALPGEKMPADGMVVLEDPGTHRRLLPYFHAKKRTGGATSEAFYEHAFGLPAIRTRLLSILGAAALAELRKPRAGHPADVNTQLTELKFHNIRKWGEFAPIPGAGAGADADLKAAVETAGGIVPFFKNVVEVAGGPWEKKVFQLWDHDPPSKDFLMDRFRGADQGKHEWIPTDYIPNVLRRAMTQRSKMVEALRWVVLHHALRSPTRYVIWELVGATPQGHSGVFWESYQKEGKTKYKFTLTKNQDKFHNRLRGVFDRWSGTALGYVAELRAKLPTIMWDGQLGHSQQQFLTTRVDALVMTSGGLVSMTVRELSELQQTNFDLINDDFDNAENAVSKEI
ncbi:HPC2 multi-domain protein [Streptomyces sp. NPDC046915]|uniref:phage tail protein n=1 Tax=Streptomyces sp. NPDC046915 TaxID=3155257 RepID=UPI0034050542